jgi:putative methanogenesis marker protein 8
MSEKKQDRHVWEIGKAKVIISDGKVISISEPLVKYCPIHEAWIGRKDHSVESILKHSQWKIRDFGLCTKKRLIYTKVKGIGYGCSESFMSAMQHGLVDAVVIACDGAGTVISATPEVIQGIGGPMNALIETTPIPELITRLQELGAIVLDPLSAKMDVLEGVKLAINLGYQKIGAIVVSSEAPIIEELRALEKAKGVQIIIFVVHTTGIPPDYINLIEKADMAHACASKIMREYFMSKARKVFGSTIPVFALSEIGEQILNIREQECLSDRPMIVVGNRRPPDLI